MKKIATITPISCCAPGSPPLKGKELDALAGRLSLALPAAPARRRPLVVPSRQRSTWPPGSFRTPAKIE
jgi:hypothetical protein